MLAKPAAAVEKPALCGQKKQMVIARLAVVAVEMKIVQKQMMEWGKMPECQNRFVPIRKI